MNKSSRPTKFSPARKATFPISNLGLPQARLALTLLDTAADGVNVPFLRNVTSLALQIVDIAERVKSNKEDCMMVVDKIRQLTEGLVNALKDKTEADVDPRLIDDLKRFEKDLGHISNVLKEVASRGTLARVIRSTQDAQEIANCKEMLNHSFQTFQVYSEISSRLILSQMQNQLIDMHRDIGKIVSQPPPYNDRVQLPIPPPPAPMVFFGRGKVVANAIDLIQNGPPARLAILGTGGIGKTSTALAILHHADIQSLFNSRCYFTLCEAAVTPGLLLSSLFQALGITKVSGGDDLTTLTQFLMKSEPLLLVLDNFETPWDECDNQLEVQAILERIASVSHLTLIVTMRGSVTPSGVIWSQSSSVSVLPVLDPDSAWLAYLAVNPDANAQSKEDLVSLLQELDYVPLAVMLMAQLGKSQTTSSLLRRWRKEKTALLHTHGSKSGRLSSIEMSISLSLKSFSMVKEGPDATELLTLICYLPEGILDWEESLSNIASGFQQAESIVAVLLQVSLAYVDMMGALKVLSPIRHYMLKNHVISKGHMLMLEQYYIDLITKYSQVPFSPQFGDSYNKLIPQYHNIRHVVKSALQNHSYQAIGQAAYQMSEFLYKARPSIDLLETLLPILDNLELTSIKASCYELMGNILHDQDRYSEAETKLKEAHQYFTDMNDHIGAIKCMWNIIDLLCLMGKYSEAEKKLNKAKVEFDKSSNQLGVAECLKNLGYVMELNCKYTEAEKYLEMACTLFKQFKDLAGEATCLDLLADVLVDQEEYDQAMEKKEEALLKFSLVGDQEEVGYCLQDLGYILHSQERYDEAYVKLKEAYSHSHLIGDRLAEAWCLKLLGGTLHEQSKDEEAWETLQEAQTQFILLGDVVGEGECLESCAEILLGQEKYDKAEETQENALAKYTLIHNWKHVADGLQSLGNIYTVQSNHSKAKKVLETAHSHFIQVGDQEGAAWCLKDLGDTLYNLGKYDTALEKLKSAQQQFIQLENILGQAECLQSLADIHLKEKRYAEAQAALETALTHFLDLDIEEGVDECKASLAQIPKPSLTQEA